MSEYELADLFLSALNTAGNSFVWLVTMMTGFVITGLFFGQILDRVMTTIVVGGYSLLVFITGFQVSRAYITFRNIAHEIRDRAATTDEFQWHGVVTSPEWFVNFGPYITVGFVVLGYVGSIIFFFRTRKLDPKDFR